MKKIVCRILKTKVIIIETWLENSGMKLPQNCKLQVVVERFFVHSHILKKLSWLFQYLGTEGMIFTKYSTRAKNVFV